MSVSPWTEAGLVAYFRFDLEPGSDPTSTAVRDFGPNNLTAAFVGDAGAGSVASTAPVVRHPTRTRVGLPVTIRLHAAEADRSALTYHITGLPKHGELYALPSKDRIMQVPYLLSAAGDGSGTPAVEYKPTAFVATSDAIEFAASDGASPEVAGVIAIVVDPVNTVPRQGPENFFQVTDE
jgi:hypothetical protein